MTTTSETRTPSDRITCNCCGQSRPAAKVHELGAAPGVHICNRCALWAAGQMSKFPIVQLDPRRLLRHLRPGRRRDRQAGAVLSVSPILASADLDRTCVYYQSLGFELVERHEGYLVMHSGASELHFSTPAGPPTTGGAFVHVADAARLWKRLRQDGVDDLGPLQDQPWGLREFVATDPDGNRIRIGSGLHDD
jgi:catechol 2,3-dioxygenase-like lactoylglutathione lyase family enzyme